MVTNKNKSISKKEAKKLLMGTDLYKNDAGIKKIQEITNPEIEAAREDVWIISDSSSSFSSLTLKNG